MATGKNMSSTTVENASNSDLIHKARKKWMDRLIDVSRLNNLLYFRDFKTGMINLDGAEPSAVEAYLSGEKVALRDLLPNVQPTDLRNRSSVIFKRAQLNQEEKGLHTLYVAMGMATWTTIKDDGRPPRAAILLLPTAVELKTQGAAPVIQRQGDPLINLSLLHVLESSYGIVINPELLLASLFDDHPETDSAHSYSVDVQEVKARLVKAAGTVEGFAIEPAIVLCNFSFQKMAMLRDIRDYPEQIATHNVLAAMAGNVAARTSLQKDRQDVPLRNLDRLPASKDFFVLDADSSQQRVIACVSQLQSGVIQGPPGTGKSQTIVNLIATLIAQGRRVLFVAEKRAALEVVYQRLKQIGLDHLVLDLHGADISSKAFYERVATALIATREAPIVDARPINETYQDRRDKLNRHVELLHAKRNPLDLSAYDLQGMILRLPRSVHSSVRWRGNDLDKFMPDVTLRVKDLLQEGAGYSGLLLNNDPSLWTNANIHSGSEAQTAIDLVNSLQVDLLPHLHDLLSVICAQLSLQMPSTIKDAIALSELLDDIDAVQKQYQPEIFEEPVGEIAGTLQPVQGGLYRFFAKLFKADYRNALSVLRHHRKGQVDEAQLREEAIKLQKIHVRWRELAVNSTHPQHIDLQLQLHDCIQGFQAVSELKKYLPKQPFMSLPIGDAEARVQKLATDASKARQLPRVRDVQRQLSELKITPLMRVFEQQNISEDLWTLAFEYALWSSCLDRAWEEWPELATFKGKTHQQIVEEFKKLDHDRTEASVDRIKRLHAENALNTRNLYPDENALIKSQSQKKRNRLQLRELLARTPHVSTALFPCWMTSPLSISQLLKANQRYFDIVIFDEASQILPEDAVPAIMRAEHVVVAGDRHQLPPTTFFAAGPSDETSDESEDSVEGFESVLDQMSGITDSWSLDWHYRSKDESLIAFSNKHIYQGRMTTFPSAFTDSAVNHVLVKPESYRDSDVNSVSAEVNQVVESVLDHARNHPDRTLGVITMGIAHADRIERALEERLTFHPELEDFFNRSRPERFFVKNLERVQGDERDSIIISIGYGKDASGRLPYRFGPLLSEGGERRLNVAVTRARYHLTLVSSFDANDMDPARSNARGIELLRLYLEYAASEGRVLGKSQGSSEYPLNPFEADVFDTLRAQGVNLIPQWGVSNYRIDFAVQHPDRPGEFVLAIECDGATYHSAPTARDRDRLRQQVLMSLGWRFHRIWSTDWFNRRDEEIQRTIDAIHTAYAGSSHSSSTTVKASDSTLYAKTVASNAATLPVQQRTRKPFIPDGRAIDAYPMDKLVEMVHWVQSDGKLRDDDELFEEVFKTLGYRRRGDKITGYITLAIKRSKK